MRCPRGHVLELSGGELDAADPESFRDEAERRDDPPGRRVGGDGEPIRAYAGPAEQLADGGVALLAVSVALQRDDLLLVGGRGGTDLDAQTRSQSFQTGSYPAARSTAAISAGERVSLISNWGSASLGDA